MITILKESLETPGFSHIVYDIPEEDALKIKQIWKSFIRELASKENIELNSFILMVKDFSNEDNIKKFKNILINNNIYKFIETKYNIKPLKYSLVEL